MKKYCGNYNRKNGYKRYFHIVCLNMIESHLVYIKFIMNLGSTFWGDRLFSNLACVQKTTRSILKWSAIMLYSLSIYFHTLLIIADPQQYSKNLVSVNTMRPVWYYKERGSIAFFLMIRMSCHQLLILVIAVDKSMDIPQFNGTMTLFYCMMGLEIKKHTESRRLGVNLGVFSFQNSPFWII